ncbi:MAG: hypothetical protein AUK34_09260 [Ignavibacteria bacterium CG2_30_36_16]|nr:MAG: hypothetical protein AUK34_09260 [Ignavibacteria bacterium CG2_30_36_16]
MFGQQKNFVIEDELIGKNYFVNSVKVQITQELINIIDNDRSVINIPIKGAKYLEFSPSNKFFIISNYQFSADKKDYPSSYFVFNAEGEKIFEYADSSPYDLPHAIHAVNDVGTLALFDPLTFQLNLIDANSKRTIKLEKEIPFEMERASFIAMRSNFVFVSASVKPTDITDNSSNVILYKIDINSLSVEKTNLELSIPTALYAGESELAAAGVKYNDSKIYHSLKLISEELKIKKEYEISAEEIYSYNGVYFTRFADKIIKLENGSTSEYKFEDGNRVIDLFVDINGIHALVKGNNKASIYKLSRNFDVDFYILLNKFESKNFTEISSAQGKYVLLQSGKTFIIN